MSYAHARQTPEAHALRIIDRRTGNELRDVVEANSDEGWLVRFRRDGSGNFIVDEDGQTLATERLDGLELQIEIVAGWQYGGRSGAFRDWKPAPPPPGILATVPSEIYAAT